MDKRKNNINIKNKRATFDYVITDTYTAGIVLTGTEIKSIRLGKASLVDTYCIFTGTELWVKNMYVAEYFYGSYNNHTARRDRKLLLERKELRKLQQAVKNPGFTIVPTRLFINERGLAKLVIALARGKHEYDKRESIKERDDKREMDRIKRHY
ncbi:MAG: SsrA-binding protein SmpB [Bacteroidaceae bacterium]|jgi:SsrA-binding protein|nr:SsrA-binding protein SmpB [Bacteroidales bacterium]MBQ3152258.1 SsrA-binding protein SmpB [Bacteroidaceae bacterium]MBR4293933.1 SsrA-binding protein SmpB [Bacteroidaceae bacterium]MBR6806678.1 SsrA-binding protein SmpB [Bacteroidaceae bacterium]